MCVKPGITVSVCSAASSTSARCMSGQQRGQAVDLAAQPQPHVGGDLVVAAAAGVQPLAGVADQLRSAAPRCSGARPRARASTRSCRLSISAAICSRPSRIVGEVVAADDALRGQHLGMRQAAVDVGPPQALVEADAGGVALHQLAHRFGEQGGPGLGLVGERVVGHRAAGRAGGSSYYRRVDVRHRRRRPT